jgi:D-alanine-D-alanine ligase
LNERRFNNVAVLMGGPSSEREVSLNSGRAVAKGLAQVGYSVVGIDVRGREVILPSGVEAVFIALHGEFGEDGELQAELDLRRVPYTGSGAVASRNAMDKIVSKRCFEAEGIPTPAYAVVPSDGLMPMNPPLVVKPPMEGSSIGCSVVTSESQWASALAEGARHDKSLLVERFIAGRELTVGILDDRPLPVIEIVAPGGSYDYSAKYTRGKTQYLVPAPLSVEETENCTTVALRVFRALGCRGFARVDIRMGSDGTPYVLELNTIPGFTETSLLPKAAACSGIAFPELCRVIMELATHDGRPVRSRDRGFSRSTEHSRGIEVAVGAS